MFHFHFTLDFKHTPPPLTYLGWYQWVGWCLTGCLQWFQACLQVTYIYIYINTPCHLLNGSDWELKSMFPLVRYASSCGPPSRNHTHGSGPPGCKHAGQTCCSCCHCPPAQPDVTKPLFPSAGPVKSSFPSRATLWWSRTLTSPAEYRMFEQPVLIQTDIKTT